MALGVKTWPVPCSNEPEAECGVAFAKVLVSEYLRIILYHSFAHKRQGIRAVATVVRIAPAIWWPVECT